MPDNSLRYGPIRTPAELGRLARAHRKTRGWTLETISGLGNLSMKFLSEFERGKETAELGKVLKALRTQGLEVVIQPRGPHAYGVATPGGGNATLAEPGPEKDPE